MKKVVGIFIAMVMFSFPMATASAQGSSNTTAKMLPSRCSAHHYGDTIVRVSVTSDGGYGYDAQYWGNGSIRYIGEMFSNTTTHAIVRFRIPSDSKIRINFWANNDKTGDVILDKTRRALFCYNVV